MVIFNDPAYQGGCTCPPYGTTVGGYGCPFHQPGHTIDNIVCPCNTWSDFPQRCWIHNPPPVCTGHHHCCCCHNHGAQWSGPWYSTSTTNTLDATA